MNATPPEASTEYSRGNAASGGPAATASGAESALPQRSREGPERLATGLFAVALLGVLLLLVAEFTTLLVVHVSGSSKPLRTVSTGSHHSYAMALIALCATTLAFAAWRVASRPALLGLGVLGVAALLIALLGDLGDATANGLILTSSHYVEAGSTPRAGLFIETLGALLLVIACVWGFLLSAPAPRPPRPGADAPSSPPPVRPGTSAV